ncbi:MAG: CorA family divalent cation transporter [Rubrobacteraceae bacterium]
MDRSHPSRALSERILRGTLKFPPLTVEDCTAPLRMPKMDAFEVDERRDVFVAVFAVRVEREESLGLRAVEVDLVVGPNYLCTVRDGPLPEIGVRLIEYLRSGNLAEEPGASLAYYVLDGLIDGHLPGLVEIATSAEELEASLDPGKERASTDALENLIALRRDLSAFRRLAIAQQEILRRVGRTSQALRGSFSDVADNQREAVDMADATRDYVEGAVEAYRLRRDERSGLGIRRLTVFAAILGPLSLLSGIYGTNFTTLPGSQGPLAFWIFIAVQVVFVVAAVVVLSKRGLL